LETALGTGTTAGAEAAALDQAIAFASSAIRDYSERSFGSASAAGVSLSYIYDGTGFLNIDDFSAITSVTMDTATLTVDREYIAGPNRGFMAEDAGVATMYEWLELPKIASQDPAMGFEYNLDTLWWKYKFHHTVVVTGTTGWPTIPPAVKQAAIWTAGEFKLTATPFASESIGSYSYVRENQNREAIPARARQLLEPYRRVKF